jgi:enoyl-CoA hydratase/carnithine racemase
MPYDEITYDIADRVATITLNRPEHLNTGTERMIIELLEAFDLADADDDVRVVVLTGAGKAFCAGADLSGGGSTFEYETDGGGGAPVEPGHPLPTRAVARDGAGLVTMRMFTLRKPVIAAINGVAVGMGATIPLAADIRIAGERARFGFVFARRGIVPEGASSWFLPRLVGMGQAAEWLYTGRVFDAAEALRGGLVSRVVPDDELLDDAYALAREIAASAPLSVALTRQMLWRMQTVDHPMYAHSVDSRAVQFTGAHPDTVEGITSFFEKRASNFVGSVNAELPDVFPDWDEPRFR